MSANKKRFQKKTPDKIIFFPNRFKKRIKQLFSNNVNQHIISPLQTFLVNMSQAILSDKKIFIISVIAAATSVIAGIMHLQMAPRMLSGNPDDGVFFIVAGALQIFWAVPVIKRGGRIWQVIGIVGTIVLMALWYATRIHLISMGGMQGGPQSHQPGQFSRGNITGGEFSRGNTTGGQFPSGGGPPRGMRNQVSRMIPSLEYFQIAFIGLYITMSIMISKKKTEPKPA